MEFSSAGILFQNIHNGTFLSGFNRKLKSWSGFGGKRIGKETAWETALREVVEEIYGIRLLPVSLDTLQQAIAPMEFFQNKDYVCFVLPIEYVFKIGEMLEMIEYKSPFYRLKYPKTTAELIELRDTEDVKHVEITELDFIKPNFSGAIDYYYLSDIKLVMRGSL